MIKQWYNFHVRPVTKALEGDAEVTTWMYDDDQKYFNFEYKIPVDKYKNDFTFEAGAFFGGGYGDMIEHIYSVEMKDGFLIIEGLKDKGNDE
jgi:hypothetical protein